MTRKNVEVFFPANFISNNQTVARTWPTINAWLKERGLKSTWFRAHNRVWEIGSIIADKKWFQS